MKSESKSLPVQIEVWTENLTIEDCHKPSKTNLKHLRYGHYWGKAKQGYHDWSYIKYVCSDRDRLQNLRGCYIKENKRAVSGRSKQDPSGIYSKFTIIISPNEEGLGQNTSACSFN